MRKAYTLMEYDKVLLTELLGKKILIKTHYGAGTKDDQAPGDYKGELLAFDGDFLKIEYEVKRFIDGANRTSKSILWVNRGYVITIEQYEEKEES